jgi:hypothetical protein
MIGKLSKAIYVTLLGARLFYDKLRGLLEEWGFIINDYDECTFNSFHVIRYLALRVTLIFSNKTHALNT